MKTLKILFKTLAVILTVLIVSAVIGAYFLIRTSRGSQWIIEKALRYQTEAGQVNLGTVKGNLYDGIAFENMTISKIKRLPASTTLQIHKLFAQTQRFSLNTLQVIVDKAAVEFEDFDPIFISGTFQDGLLDVKVNAANLGIKNIVQQFPKNLQTQLMNIEGNIQNTDIQITGKPKAPIIKWQSIVEHLQRDALTLEQVHFSGGMEWNSAAEVKSVIPAGELIISQGRIQYNGNPIEIKLSKIIATELFIKPQIKLKLKNSDTIVVSGTVQNQELDLNIFSPGVRFEDVLPFLPDETQKDLRRTTGLIKNIDLFVTGPIQTPVLRGDALIDHVYKDKISIEQTLVGMDLEAKGLNPKKNLRLKGKVVLKEGVFSSNRTRVDLEEGIITFSELALEPQLNIKGISQVEKTRIKIRISGTPKKPDIELSSEPSYPKARILVMLATGKEWRGVTHAYENQAMTPAMAKDFVDYFLFGGKGDGLADKLGLSDVTFSYSEQKRGVGVKKEVNKDLEVGYQVEQSTVIGQIPSITQKVSSEVKVTDKLSIEAKKEFLDKTNATPDAQSDDSLMIKYKKSF